MKDIDILYNLNKQYLEPIYDSCKSFYKKAYIENDNTLYSYDTKVAEFIDGKPIIYNMESKTTIRHIKEFLLQYKIEVISTKQIKEDYYK